jgi:hypothetical protein
MACPQREQMLASADRIITGIPAHEECSVTRIQMAQLFSVNVGLPREIEWKGRTVRTGVWKDAVRGRNRYMKLAT